MPGKKSSDLALTYRFATGFLSTLAMDYQLLQAMEANPEAFASVEMLYVPVTINGFTFPLLVDTGAQKTILSPQLVEKFKIGHLIDRRFQGMAQGVGTGKMEGTIHNIDMEMQYMQCNASFVILDVGSTCGLLGLDWMRKHHVNVNLKLNGLEIPTGYNDETVLVKFMPDWEVKQMMKNLNVEMANNPAGSSYTPQQPPSAPTISGPGQRLGGNIAATPSYTSAPTATPAASAPAPVPAALTSEQEGKVRQLVDMGFPRSAVIQALKSTNWNIEIAGGLLFM